jgi:hypothetical protein
VALRTGIEHLKEVLELDFAESKDILYTSPEQRKHFKSKVYSHPSHRPSHRPRVKPRTHELGDSFQFGHSTIIVSNSELLQTHGSQTQTGGTP